MQSQETCNPYFLAQGRRFAPTLEVHQVRGDVHIGRLIACSCSLVPSPRANGSARLWPSWSAPFRDSWRRASERTVGSLAALMEHTGLGIPGTEPPSKRVSSFVALMERAKM